MGPFCVVVFPPLFDQDLRFAQAVEYLAVEKFIPHPPVEAFDECVLAWFSRRDVMPVDPGVLNPPQDGHAGEFGAQHVGKKC